MKFTKHQKIIIGAALALAAAGLGFVFLGKGPAASSNIFTVMPKDLTEQVEAQGTVVPAKSADLAFDRSGRIAAVNVSVGAKVFAGENLVSEDNADLKAALDQAEAGVEAAQARLNQLKNGAKPEQIAINQTAVANAQTALSGVSTAALSAINAAYASADDAVRNKADQEFSNPLTANAVFNINLSDSQLLSNLSFKRVLMEKSLTDWKNYNATLTGSSDIDAALQYAENKLNDVRMFLELIASSLNSAMASASVPQSQIDGYKANISTARTAISGAISSIVASDNNWKSASDSLKLAQNQLVLAQSGGSADEIAAQEAVLSQTEASVASANAMIRKTYMTAPFSGTVTKVDAKVGEVAAPSVPLVSVISDSKFQIETYVSEADIGKVKIGDSAAVMLDAFPGETFSASIISIDPAETKINGSSAYKVKLEFQTDDQRIKSGLGANVTIATQSKTKVLAIPQDSIITKGNDKYVMVDRGGTEPEMRKISVGIFGQGFVEVISGLLEGDRVMSFGAANIINK